MKTRRGQRGSLVVLTTIALPTFLIPMLGLGVDATICNIVQTQLSAAVDGASLAAGRLLANGGDPADIAQQVLKANFRVGQSGFWGATNLQSTINVQTGTTKTVSVTASASVPLIFMRLIQSNAAVAATATATRRDARIELVIDRSGSMNNSDSAGSTVIADLVNFAQGFTGQFYPGHDEMGLVVFNGSAVVGYPTTPWPAPLSPTGSGGPDTSFLSGDSTDMVHQIAAIKAGGGTAMGDALALAYVELQKAHMRDLQAQGYDSRSNAIVLFTDGVPSSVVTYLNRNTNSVIASGSGCTYKTDTATPANPIYGYAVLSGSPPYSGAPYQGFYQLSSIDTTSGHTSQWFMGNTASDPSPPQIPVPTGCNTAGWNWNSSTNLSAIPSFDKYGYSLGPTLLPNGAGSGYQVSAFVNNPSATSIYNGTAFKTTSPTDAYQWGLASWDEVDQVSQAIRTDANFANRPGDTTGPLRITIYTVGYTGNGGTDYGLLEKIANVQGCKVNGLSCYNNTQPSGQYIQASNKNELANAFQVIATTVLRLAR
jgi:Flp pilus assembly protein TadG